MALFNDDIRKILDEAHAKAKLRGGNGVTPMGPRVNGIHSITAPYEEQPETVIPPNAQSTGGGYDEGADNLEMKDGAAGIQPQKKGLSGLFSSLFRNRTPQPGPDGAPVRDKPSIFKTIADVALPTLFGAASGVGILPGLISGIGSHNAGIEGKYRRDVDDYQGQQKIGNDADFNQALLGQKSRDFDLKQQSDTDDWNASQRDSDIGRLAVGLAPKVGAKRDAISDPQMKRYIQLSKKFKNNPDSLSDAEIDILTELKSHFDQ